MTDFAFPLKWVDELKQNPGCSRFLSDFLDFILAGMLVVDVSKRQSIVQVARELGLMYQACRMDKMYTLPAAVSSSQEHTKETGNAKEPE